MGSLVEINDTLQLTEEQGFPAGVLNLQRHLQTTITLSEIAGYLFAFDGKERPRIFHLDPVRVYLVQNIDDKWLFWGKVLVQSQNISKKLNIDGKWTSDEWITSGTYRIIELYEPKYQELFTRRESPAGKSYFT